MGLGRYLRRHIALPITRRIDMQSELLCELHLRALLRTPPYEEPKRLEAYGFRSFSQNDEDGILQEIFRRIGLSTEVVRRIRRAGRLAEQHAPVAVPWLERNVDRSRCTRMSQDEARIQL